MNSNKLLKIIAIAVAAVVGVLVVAIGVAAMLFDPNDYRDEIAAKVRERTGRELTIAGSIELRVFPWLGMRLTDATLGNAPGFGPEPFAQIREVDAGVKLLPLLFDREVQIGTVTLDGLVLNLARDAKGVDNWSDLAKREAPAPADAPKPEDGVAIRSLAVEKVAIKDSTLTFKDAAAGKTYKAERIELATGRLVPGEAADLDGSFLLTLSDPDLVAESKLSGRVITDTDGKKYRVEGLKLETGARGAPIPGGAQDLALSGNIDFDQGKNVLQVADGVLSAAGVEVNFDASGPPNALSGSLQIPSFSPREALEKLGIPAPQTQDGRALSSATLKARYQATPTGLALKALDATLDQSHITGDLTVRDFATQALTLALTIDQLDVDRYLSPKAAAAGEAVGTPDKKGDINQVKLPAEAINKLNLAGTVSIGTLVLRGMTLRDVQVKFDAAPGAEKTQTMSGKLYGGQIESRTRMVPGSTPTYATDLRLRTIDAAPLLKDFLGKDYLAGIGNFSVELAGTGDTVGELRRTLDGALAFNLANGAVKGFNLGQYLRKAKALTQGATAAAAGGAGAETDFAELKGTARIVDGVLQSDDLSAKNPLIRLLGAGKIDLAAEQIDYLARPTIVESSKGQGGAELAELKGIELPIRISGSLFKPSIRLDLSAAIQQQAAGKLREQYKEAEDKYKDDLKDKVNDKLGEGAADALRGLFGKPKKTPDPAAAPPPPHTDVQVPRAQDAQERPPPAAESPATQPAPAQPAPAAPATPTAPPA